MFTGRVPRNSASLNQNQVDFELCTVPTPATYEAWSLCTRTLTAKCNNAWFSLILPSFPGQSRPITSDDVTFRFSSFDALHRSVGFLGFFLSSCARRGERQCRSDSGWVTNRHTHSCCLMEWGSRDANLVDWLCTLTKTRREQKIMKIASIS